MRFLTICLFTFLFVCISKKSICQAEIKKIFLLQRNLQQNSFKELLKIQENKKVIKINQPILQNPNAISNNYYYNNVGFFCKQEIKLEKIISFPVAFRLGSLEYCNKIEGKLH